MVIERGSNQGMRTRRIGKYSFRYWTVSEVVHTKYIKSPSMQVASLTWLYTKPYNDSRYMLCLMLLCKLCCVRHLNWINCRWTIAIQYWPFSIAVDKQCLHFQLHVDVCSHSMRTLQGSHALSEWLLNIGQSTGCTGNIIWHFFVIELIIKQCTAGLLCHKGSVGSNSILSRVFTN